jgi:hypothetical protein
MNLSIFFLKQIKIKGLENVILERCFATRSVYGDVTIPDEGLQNLGSGLLSREGSLSCHTCCDTGPRFFRSHPKDRHIQSLFKTQKGMLRTYSNPYPHGPPFCRLL